MHAFALGGAANLAAGVLRQSDLAHVVGHLQQFVDRGPSAEAGVRALDATLSFIERSVSPFLRIQTAGLQLFDGIMDLFFAEFADHSHQPLRQNAVQRRNEVVGLDSHVEEAAQHVHHVVGVDGGEHQVAGERRVNGNLRRLGVANFAHHDLVGIVTQDGAQTAGKGQSLFLVHRNLGNAANLVFDRVFDGDQLVFVALDLVQRRVQRGGFARARRSGDQHHPVRLLDVATELAQVFIAETDHVEGQLVELLAYRLLVEHPTHRVFAVNRGHDGDAEVDGASEIAHPETPVLRDPALGDVQLAHDLDTRDDGGMVLLGDGLHGLLQHAVNAVLDDHGIVARFDVNIAGAPLQRREDGGVHQPDDGADVGLGRQLLDGDGFVGIFVFDNYVQREALAGFLQHALRLLGLFQDVADLGQAGYFGGDAPAQQQADLVDHHQLTGIGDSNHQPAIGLVLQRHEVVAEHQVDRNLAEQVVLNVKVLDRKSTRLNSSHL